MTDNELILNASLRCPDCNFVRKCQSMVFAGWGLPPRFRAKLHAVAETGQAEEPEEDAQDEILRH